MAYQPIIDDVGSKVAGIHGARLAKISQFLS